VGLFAAALVPSCDGGETTAGSSGAAGEGGGLPPLDCPESGVLHGPWSLHFDETSVVVRWDACAPSSAEISVEPEGGGDALVFTGEQSASDVTTSYAFLEGVPPDLPGVYYRTEVVATGLTAGSCYRYQLAADSGRRGRFCTAKPAGAPFKFMAIGDTNPAVGDTAGVLDHTLDDSIDFSLHLGDVQYYASVFDSWAHWFPEMAPLLEQGAFQPSVGNHEYERDNEFQDYYERLFGGAGFDGTTEHYRFQSGGVWFFSINSEDEFKAGTPQAEWLEEQIVDAAGRPGYRFGVVYFHKPMMTLSDYAQQSSERQHFDPIFRANGVKLILSGHVHGYERFVDGDLTYVVSGGGGALLHDLDVSIDDRPEQAMLRQASAKEYHATLIEVGETEIHGSAVSNEGDVIDDFVIPLP
jgi:acid phosphatase type 7